MPHNNLEHIAFILDGNKRWAKKNNINLKNAYKKGLENISDLISNCLRNKIKISNFIHTFFRKYSKTISKQYFSSNL